MSGIAGIVHFDGRPVAPGEIEAMTATMDYRGPDGIHHWTQGSVALGQCMLRTTPESMEETQPLANEDGSLVLVLDGRIDNWEDLRSELLKRGAHLRTHADAELVLRAYESWGDACPAHLDGDFAFALWDVRRQALYCARDRVGNRPFHYHWNGRSLAFATDLHAVLNLPWVPEQVDEDTLAEYLATEWLTIDTTLWQAIRRLPPAQSMLISGAGAPRFSKYWAPDPHATLPCKTDDDWIAAYRELFTDVVRRTLRSHRPLAIEVSGGLDSSSIFATAMHLQAQGRLPAPGVEGYTLDFSGDPVADELDYAKQVGAYHGVPIHALPPGHAPLERYRADARRFRTFPGFPNGGMGDPIAVRARAAGGRVLVSGTGGDEWSGGEASYAEALQLRQWAALRALWQHDRGQASWPAVTNRLLRRGLVPLLPAQAQDALRRVRQRITGRGGPGHAWLAPALQQRWLAVRSNHLAARSQGALVQCGQRLAWALLYDPYWQFAKGIGERCSAVDGLEWRQPFWNYRLIEFAFAAPVGLKQRGDVDRWLHRQAMRDRLPDTVRLRTSKAEFSSTFQAYWPALLAEIERIAPRRSDWVRAAPLRQRMEQAFTPQASGWNEGAPWVLFALDSVLPAAA